MDEATFHAALLRVWLVLAAAAFAALSLAPAPYGRHGRPGWGPKVRARWGWLLMELPSALGMALLFVIGDRRTAPAIVFLVMWELHYVHRAFVFPFRRGGEGRRLPWAIVAMAAGFNTVNVYLNGRALFTLGEAHAASWLASPPFLIGALLFLGGFALNLGSDAVLARLRRPGESGYRIPRGGPFEWISCPNYAGEIVEWAGWAIATSTLAGWSFALWTAANLVPRALAHHRWYRERFPDYPRERKALVPWVL